VWSRWSHSAIATAATDATVFTALAATVVRSGAAFLLVGTGALLSWATGRW